MKKKNRTARTLTTLAISSSLSLLSQCFSLLLEFIHQWEWTLFAVTIFLVIVDFHTLLLLLYYSHNATKVQKKNSNQNLEGTAKLTKELSMIQDDSRKPLLLFSS